MIGGAGDYAHTVAAYAVAAILSGFAGFIWIGLIEFVHDIWVRKDANDE